MTAKRKITDKNGVQVFPITHTKAVLDDNGNSVEQRLQEQMDVINQKQLEIGAVPSDTAPTEGSTNWVTSGGVFETIQKNTIEEINESLSLVQNKWIDANENSETFGQAIAINSTGYCVSDYIKVYQDDSFTILVITGTGDSNAINNGGYVLYDANMTPISGVVTMTTTSFKTSSIDIIIPEGVYYLRFSCPSNASPISINRKSKYLMVSKEEFDSELAERTLSNKSKGQWEVRLSDKASVEYVGESVVMENVAKAANNAIYYDLHDLKDECKYDISFDYITSSGRDFYCGFYASQNTSNISLSYGETIKQNASGAVKLSIIYNDSLRYFGFVFGASQDVGFTCTISNFKILAHESVDNILYRDDVDKLVLSTKEGQEIKNKVNDINYLADGMRRLYLEYKGSENAHTNIYTYMVAKPYEGVKLHFSMPLNCRAYLLTSWGLGVNSFSDANIFANGDVYTDNVVETHLMIGFFMLDENGNYINTASSSGYNPVPQLRSMLESGKIAVYYKDYGSVIDRNIDAQQDCDSNLIRNVYSTYGNKSLSKIMYPIITHISDTHNDVERYINFLEFSDFIGARVAVHTGDVSAYNAGSGVTYIHALKDKYSTPVAVCVGNHDAGNGGDVQLINSVKEDYGYLESPDIVTTHTYYYQDYDDVKLRIIALNYNENGATSTINVTQEQVTWLCSVLKSTPQDYGVLIIAHYSEVDVVRDENYSKFSAGTLTAPSTLSDYHFVTDILDAFIARQAINKSYTPTYKGTQVTITVNDDFSNVASGVEFIAILCGHYHNDYVGYAESQQKQLVLNVTCGIALYSDVPGYTYALGSLVRRGKTVTQDAFNVYGIDRERKLVHIIRVGARKTMDNEIRDYESIPYAD